ncbi:MAG: hypothetical protein IPH10_04535 [bacterium]|nr:hypothetical protein [bacterium]
MWPPFLGSVLAVCSCTVPPLFGGIYKMGETARPRHFRAGPGDQRLGHRPDGPSTALSMELPARLALCSFQSSPACSWRGLPP